MPVPSNARVQATVLPELVLCPPPDSRLVTFPFTPTLGYNPNMLVPHTSFIPPQSSFIVPEFQPSWYLPTQTVPFYNPCSSNLLLRTARQPPGMAPGPPGPLFINVLPAVEAGGAEQSKEQSKTEDEQNVAGEKKEPERNVPHTETQRPAICPGAEATPDADVQAKHNLEELITFIDELCAQDNNNAEVKGQEKDEADKQNRAETEIEKENRMLLEYLDSVCSDDDFMRTVDSFLDVDYLNLLFTDDTLAKFGEQDQKDSVDSYLSHYPETNTLDVSLLKELEQGAAMTTSANQPPVATSGPAETNQETSPPPSDKRYDTNDDAQTPRLTDPVSPWHSDLSLMDDITLPLQSATHCLTFDVAPPAHESQHALHTADAQTTHTPKVNQDKDEESDINVMKRTNDADDLTGGEKVIGNIVLAPAPSPQHSPERQLSPSTMDEMTTVNEMEETDKADEESLTPEGGVDTDPVDEFLWTGPTGPSGEETGGARGGSPSKIQTRRSTRNTKYKDFELSDAYVAETRAKKRRKK